MKRKRNRLVLSFMPGLFLVAVAVAAHSSGCDNSDLGGITTGADMSAPPDLSGGCGLVTCQSMGAGCGLIGDGCGGTVNCGSCPFPQTCGGGGVQFQCGGSNACAPLTCTSLSLSCGISGDGCGGTINCYPNGATSCPNPDDTCGGGGTPGVCGSQMGTTGGCTPRTCAGLGYGCGMTSDGCGGTLNCDPPGGCPNGQTCGGGGVQFQCGTAPAPCVPKTSCPAGLNCGSIGDGCGGTLNCAMASPACPGAETCGGGGIANVCGPPQCMPKTTANCGTSCGYINDGCGGTVDCSTINPCPMGQTCGGSGMANVCGSPTCVPKTCAMLGANCGWAGDGCGNLICCGTLSGGVCSTTCPPGQLCGSVQPNQCGNNISGGGGGTCMPGVNTTITGTVVAPTDSTAGFGNPDPIFNATVFVPEGPVQPITTGATCDQCATSTPAIVSTTTAVDGTFTLTNPPTGSNITVVIQLGKWRRVLTLATVTPCVNNVLTTAQTRLPRKQAEFSPYDNIPRLAISTGNVDTMECVLRKMGIADTEFVNGDTGAGVPTAGRVQLYQADYMTVRGAPGAVIDMNTPSESNLWGNPATLDAYDAILFPCTGGRTDKTTTAQKNLVDYTNKGGRVFATHFSYVWLYKNTQLGSVAPLATSSWQSTASWIPDTGSYNGPNNGLIDLSFPKGINLSQWLTHTVPPTAVTLSAAMTAAQTTATVASTTGYPSAGTLIIDQEQVIYSSISGTQFKGLTRGANGTAAATHAKGASAQLWAQIPVNVLRNDFTTPLTNAQRWMYAQNAAPGNGPANFPIHYTFNTPVGLSAANQCGRVVFSDFHVENSSGSEGIDFPTECNAAAPLTPQEKLLEFMLFDLTSCVAPDVPTCTPKTCNNIGAQPYTCGQWGDGCGGTLSCGACTAPQTCGGAGVPGQCGNPMCVPKTCAMLGNVCGTFSDGCSGKITCTCAGGSSCVSGTCVAPCTPATCSQLGYACGSWSDGCGGIVTCPRCETPQTCGGSGVPGQCGGCVPFTCSQLGLSCGNSGDGCGGMLTCGTCTAPNTCGGGGVPGQCGSGGSMCKPLTCAQQGLACGTASDGCGNTIQCGTCPTGQTCGGAGTPGQCGSTGCTPLTSCPAPDNCGLIGDGCGGTVNCGTCGSGDSCGILGTPNVCGSLG